MMLGRRLMLALVFAGACSKSSEPSQVGIEPPRAPSVAPDASQGATVPDDFLVLAIDGARYRLDDPVSVRRIKDALKARGYDPGPIDGVPDSRLHAALGAFQRREAALQRDRTPPKQPPRIGLVDRTTATWLGVDFAQLVAAKQPIPMLDNDSLSHDPNQVIQRGYENSRTGQKIFEGSQPAKPASKPAGSTPR